MLPKYTLSATSAYQNNNSHYPNSCSKYCNNNLFRENKRMRGGGGALQYLMSISYIYARTRKRERERERRGQLTAQFTSQLQLGSSGPFCSPLTWQFLP